MAIQKLYLGSQGLALPGELEQLAGASLDQLSVAVIPNALDNRYEKLRADRLAVRQKFIGRLGMTSTEIDLRTVDTESLVDEYDIIHIMGGHPLDLLRAMTENGLHTRIPNQEDSVLWTESAATIAMGSMMSYVDIIRSREDIEIFNEPGLGIVPKIFAPHADRQAFAHYISYMRINFEAGVLVTLNDDQAYVVNNGFAKLVMMI